MTSQPKKNLEFTPKNGIHTNKKNCENYLSEKKQINWRTKLVPKKKKRSNFTEKKRHHFQQTTKFWVRGKCEVPRKKKTVVVISYQNLLNFKAFAKNFGTPKFLGQAKQKY